MIGQNDFMLSLGYKIDKKIELLHKQKSYTPQNEVYNQSNKKRNNFYIQQEVPILLTTELTTQIRKQNKKLPTINHRFNICTINNSHTLIPLGHGMNN